MKYYEIDEKTAQTAHMMNQMRDYIVNETTNRYRRYVDEVYEIGDERKQKYPDEAERIDYLCERYAKKLAYYFNENSRVEAMCPSVLISGAGNFPTEKKEKQNARRNGVMELWKELEELKDRIASCGSDVIKSDDARALEKLRLKLERLTDAQEEMKAANAYYRENKTLEGCPGVDDEMRERLEEPGRYYAGTNGSCIETWGCPFPSYVLSNNSAEIRRIKQRLEKLEAVKETGTQEQAEEEIGIPGVRVVENAEAMRIQLIFDGKPDEETRNLLKHWGFKWSPRFSAWQRMLNENGKYAAMKVIKKIKEQLHG